MVAVEAVKPLETLGAAEGLETMEAEAAFTEEQLGNRTSGRSGNNGGSTGAWAQWKRWQAWQQQRWKQ